MANGPLNRKKNVTGKASEDSMQTHGPGMGQGPVGASDGYQARKEQQRPAPRVGGTPLNRPAQSQRPAGGTPLNRPAQTQRPAAGFTGRAQQTQQSQNPQGGGQRGTPTRGGGGMKLIIIAIIVAMVVLVILLNDAERRIPVQYAQKIQGRRLVGGANSVIPLKVNTAGVMPIIFASSLMEFPVIISTLAGYKGTGIWSEILRYLSSSYWCNPGQPKYTIGLLVYIALLVFFAYFYTSITFNPLEIADNLKKRGGFIPGIRPGKPTIEYLNRILNYIIFIGAIGLTIVGILPFIFRGVFGASISFGGTSLIIVVSVVLETIKQIESMMMVRNYKGFLNE